MDPNPADRDELREYIDPRWEPEDIPALHAMDRLRPHYSLLKHLLGRDEAQFRLRGAILHTFRDEAFLSSQDLDRELRWMLPDKRSALLTGLKEEGWLDRLETKGYCLSTHGRQLSRILFTFIGSITSAEEGSGISPGTEGADLLWAISTNADPAEALRSYRVELEAVAGRIDDALSTDSSRRLNAVRQEATNLVRTVTETRRAIIRLREDSQLSSSDATEVFDLISRVIDLHGEMERRLTEYKKSFIGTDPAMTPERILSFLVEKGESLADAAESMIRFPLQPPVLVNPLRFMQDAEGYLSSFQGRRPDPVWEAPERLEAAVVADAEVTLSSAEVKGLMDELIVVAASRGTVPAHTLFPRATVGESFLRQALTVHAASKPDDLADMLQSHRVHITNQADALDEGEAPTDDLPEGPMMRTSRADIEVSK